MIASRSADWKDSSSPASKAADWMAHYASMEEEMEKNTVSQARKDAGLPDTDEGYERPVSPPAKKLPPIVEATLAKNKITTIEDTEEEEVDQEDEERPRLLSKKDARILLSIRELIASHMQREEQVRRGRTITVVDSNKFRIGANSIENYIARALQNSETGMHLNDIITGIEALGWRTTSVHHKYAEVYRAIRQHYYMFEKMGKAKFRLRAAFSQRPMDRTPISISVDTNKGKLTTLKDIAVSVVEKFYAPPGIYPSLVWAIMRRMGYDCSYSAVYKAMQDESKFVKEGFFYALAGSNADKKSPEKSKRS
jgi:hypothetical protein